MTTKLYLKVLRKLILSSIILFSVFSANSQMHCRSMLAGHLTPFHSSVPVLWAVEGTMAPGVMTDFNTDPTILSGGMILAALDITFLKKSNLYFEGGYKKWNNSALPTQTNTGRSRNIGMRQAYYTFTRANSSFKLGLHETTLGDYKLIDERMLGASLDQKIEAFSISVRSGTVMKNFARMGQFCANRHLYNIIDSNANSYTENIGAKPGETNLFGITINWDPSHIKSSTTSTDDFSDFNDFSDIAPQEPFVSNVGLIFYAEFGKIIPDHKLYFGSLIDFNLPLKVKFQTGGIYQNMHNNNSFVYISSFKRSFSLNSVGNTQIAASYIGKQNINNNAIFQPLFSNLFIGEIMRLDATDFPLWQTSIKHNFPGKIKFHVELKSTGQIYDNKTFEIDLETGFKLFDHAKITTIFSRVQSAPLQKDIYMARLELRVAF